jgi:hypothetical protein
MGQQQTGAAELIQVIQPDRLYIPVMFPLFLLQVSQPPAVPLVLFAVPGNSGKNLQMGTDLKRMFRFYI